MKSRLRSRKTDGHPIFVDQGMQTEVDEVEAKLQSPEVEHSRLSEALRDTLSDVKERSMSVDRMGGYTPAVLDIDSLHSKIDEVYHTLCNVNAKIDCLGETTFKGTEALQAIQSSGRESIEALNRGIHDILCDDTAIKNSAASLLDRVTPTLVDSIPATFASVVSNKINSLKPDPDQFFHIPPSRLKPVAPVLIFKSKGNMAAPEVLSLLRRLTPRDLNIVLTQG